jgi:hypothetical protein
MSIWPIASVSMDLDNLWAYLRTHGDPDWERMPSFLPAAVSRLLEVIGENELSTTAFVVGADVVRDDGASAVAAITAAGHEIANHSYHHDPRLHRRSRDDLTSELVRTEQAIIAAGAPRPIGFRGPGYSVSRELIEVLAERGYSYDASTFPTWIGPLARAYHNRAAPPTVVGSARAELFGSFSRVWAPNKPFRWRIGSSAGPVELPVTTMPLLRLPIHGAYLLQLHQLSPRLARGYFTMFVRSCVACGVGPSLLLHPTDVLDAKDAPGMEFFPGMAVPAVQKVALLKWILATLSRWFDVVGTAEHATRVDVFQHERDAHRLVCGR